MDTYTIALGTCIGDVFDFIDLHPECVRAVGKYVATSLTKSIWFLRVPKQVLSNIGNAGRA